VWQNYLDGCRLQLIAEFVEVESGKRLWRLHPFVNDDLSCSRRGSVPFSCNNATVGPVEARLSAAIKRETETMPNTENGTVWVVRQRAMLRVVGEPAAPHVDSAIASGVRANI